MSEYWGMPEKEYDLSLLQFARDQLSAMGYLILSEKVEVCSGAGALTITAVLEARNSRFGLYLHDGPKHRKTRGPPVIRVLRLLKGMENAEELRSFVLSHEHDFHILLAPEDDITAKRIEADIRKIYALLYVSIIKDLYENNLSSAADVLRKRLRRVILL